MIFNVTLIDPPGYKYAYLLTDICRLFAYTLRTLGHSCHLGTNNLVTDATNIIVGSHLLSAEEANAIAKSGMRYIVLQSEWLAHSHSQNQIVSSFQGSVFALHMQHFFEHAHEVWEAYENNIEQLVRFNVSRARIRKIASFGFHPDLVDIKHRPWQDKDVDILFLGSITPRRRAVIDRLSGKHRVLAVLDAPAGIRNDLIARAKLNLNVHVSDAFRHISLSRVSYLLNNRCMVVSETAETNSELHPLMICADYDRLVDVCGESLARPDAESFCGLAHERFRGMPMVDLLRAIVS